MRTSGLRDYLDGPHKAARDVVRAGLADADLFDLAVRLPRDEYRDTVLRQFPATFSVPARWARHMMMVADLAHGDAGAVEDALFAAWDLQRSAG